MANDNWTDEEVRYFFTLYADEKRKGNRPRSGINVVGKDFIIKKFEEKFGKRWIWDRFKNKVDISRKAYVKFKKLTHNRTGLVYDAAGRLEMSDEWWDQRIVEWQGARKYKSKVPPNMDVFETEFGAVTVTGAEGWCAQQGEASLDSRVDAEKDDESDSVDTDMPAPREGTSRARGSKRKRKKLGEVLSALLKFAADSLKPEDGEFTRVSPVLRSDDRYWPCFRDCIGALDGTHISVRPPKHNAEAYRGRKHEPTMNVLAICNFDMKFIYAYVGVPGRAHDTKVLTYCARNEPFFPHPPDGKYYLVDAGYPTRTGYLGPYRRVRYHLNQFNRGGPPTNTREVFNRRHSSMRSVIERTFGVWKAKWRILDRRHPKYGLVKWIKLVTATMALHNFIRDSHREDNDFLHWQRREDYVIHGDEDEDDDDDDDDDGYGGHIPYEPRGDRVMEALRDQITTELSRGYRLPY